MSLPAILWAIVGYALRLFGLYVVWFMARYLAARYRIDAEKTRGKGFMDSALAYSVAAFAVMALTWFFWMSYGTHTKSGEDSDPLYGGSSETVIDFKPTAVQRWRHALPIGLTVMPVALYGTWYGRRHWKRVVQEDPV
jgi:hypothetical protein